MFEPQSSAVIHVYGFTASHKMRVFVASFISLSSLASVVHSFVSATVCAPRIVQTGWHGFLPELKVIHWGVHPWVWTCVQLCFLSALIYEHAAQTQTGKHQRGKHRSSQWWEIRRFKNGCLMLMNGFVLQTKPARENVEIPLSCWQTVVRGLRLMKGSQLTLDAQVALKQWEVIWEHWVGLLVLYIHNLTTIRDLNVHFIIGIIYLLFQYCNSHPKHTKAISMWLWRSVLEEGTHFWTKSRFILIIRKFPSLTLARAELLIHQSVYFPALTLPSNRQNEIAGANMSFLCRMAVLGHCSLVLRRYKMQQSLKWY